MTGLEIIASISGGKDSAAVYLRLLELGVRFRAVMADTCHEHPWTYDFVRDLPRLTGGPEIEIVRQDFTSDFERKRRYIRDKWPEKGVPAARVARALELFHPTGNAFLDLCMLKGRFPSTKARFCTEELKIRPIQEQVYRPILAGGAAVCNVQGVRAEESAARSVLPRWSLTQPFGAGQGRVWIYRPIHGWALADVWAIHARHGIAPNRLYTEAGMGRVGCLPCIMARKDEIRLIARQFPEIIELLAEWESIVGEVSRRGTSSFFAHDKTPGVHQGRPDIKMPGIREVADWSMTSRGGRQYDALLMYDALDDLMSPCAALGVCE